jgi:hypothetical protein
MYAVKMIQYLYTNSLPYIESNSYLDLQNDNTAISYIRFLLNMLIDELTLTKKKQAEDLSAIKKPKEDERMVKKGKIYRSLFKKSNKKEEYSEEESECSDSEDLVRKISNAQEDEVYNQDKYSEESEYNDDDDDDLYIEKLGSNDEDDNEFVKEKRIDYSIEDIIKDCGDISCSSLLKSFDEFKELEITVHGIQNSNSQFYNYLMEALPKAKKSQLNQLIEFKKLLVNDSTKVRKIKKIVRHNDDINI